ncbi:DinB family protein [Paenibacillus xylaniclasticus]|uniref:DinB family protein n=1 Tax=Paenibacillus xylaniclasticus TaxID=588083 RepID=UPI0035A233C4
MRWVGEQEGWIPCVIRSGDSNRSIQLASDTRLYYIRQVPGIVNDLPLLLTGLSNEQLQTPYREGGWTNQQIVHHMADNDMNAVLRFKRALTEESPSACSYREDSWAELQDYKLVPITVSLSLLE